MIFLIKPAEANVSKPRFVSISKLNEHQKSNGKSQSQYPRLNCLLERFTAVRPIEIAMVNDDCEKVAQKKLLPESKKLPFRTNEGYPSEDI